LVYVLDEPTTDLHLADVEQPLSLRAALTYGIGVRVLAARIGLLVGILTFSIVIFVVTIRHLDVSDFACWQAWAWVVLFAAFPVTAAIRLVRGFRQPSEIAASPPLPTSRRALAAVIAVVLLDVAAALCFRGASLLPVQASAFGAELLGCWAFFVATLVVWVVLRPPAGTVPQRLARPRSVRPGSSAWPKPGGARARCRPAGVNPGA
jgi:hypothetical protein